MINLSNIANHRKLITSLITIIIFLLVFLLIMFSAQIRKQYYPPAEPTATPAAAENPLYVTKTYPASGDTDVAANQEIIVTFNRQPLPEEVLFSIDPEVDYELELQGNKLTVSPKIPFDPGVLYTYIVRFPKSGKLPVTYSFTATGPVRTVLPDTQPKGAAEESERYQKENQPDLYLSNKTPYETDLFSVVSDFKNEPKEHFYFTVTLKGPNNQEAKRAVFLWMKSSGLTNEQIASLEITYQNQ